MPSIKHPFDPDSLYQVDEDDNIRVTNGNQWGVFTKEGVHLSGEIRQADPQLCVCCLLYTSDAADERSV